MTKPPSRTSHFHQALLLLKARQDRRNKATPSFSLLSTMLPHFTSGLLVGIILLRNRTVSSARRRMVHFQVVSAALHPDANGCLEDHGARSVRSRVEDPPGF